MRDVGSENRSTIARRSHRSVALDSQQVETGAKNSISVLVPRLQGSFGAMLLNSRPPADKHCVNRNRTESRLRTVQSRTERSLTHDSVEGSVGKWNRLRRRPARSELVPTGLARQRHRWLALHPLSRSILPRRISLPDAFSSLSLIAAPRASSGGNGATMNSSFWSSSQRKPA